MLCLLLISSTVLVIQSRWAEAPEILHVSHLTTIIQPICMFVCRASAVNVSKFTRRKWCNHRHQRVQPSSVLKIKMMQPSRTNFSFAIITSYWNKITPATHEDNLEMKVKNPYESQEDRAVIRVGQSENILLRFLRRGHDDDGCSCNQRGVPPSDTYRPVSFKTRFPN